MSVPTLTLADFLLARIAENEAKARKTLVAAQQVSLQLEDPKFLGLVQPGWYLWPDVEAVLAHVLAECEAKRQIVQDYQRYVAERRRGPTIGTEGDPYVLTLLAMPYAEHPDFREEWRP